ARDYWMVQSGRRPAGTKRTLMQQVICYRNEAELVQGLRHQSGPNPGQSPAALLEGLRSRSPNVIAGAPSQVIEQIQAYAGAGVDEIMVQRHDLDDIDGLQIIAEEVLPRV